MNHLQQKLRNNIIAEYFYSFINNLSMSSSIWVLYLAYKGMNLMQIGLLEGIYHLTGLLFEIPSGAAADLLGRKKTLIISRILMVISCIIMLFADSFLGFALSFLFQALSGNFNSGAEEALLFDSLKLLGKEEHYLTVSGRISTLFEVSQGIATVAGGILAEYSYTFCYVACIIIALLGLIPALIMTEPPVEATEAPTAKKHVSQIVKEHFITSSNILKKDKILLQLILYYSVIFSAYTLLFFYSQQYFHDHGLNKIQISIVMFFAGIAACLGALLIATFFNSLLYPIQSNALNQRIPSAQRATLISVTVCSFPYL